MAHKIRHWIKNQYDDGDNHFVVVRPSDGEEFLHVPRGDQKTVDAAVNAAREAFPAWSSLALEERCKYVDRMADWLVDQYGQEGETTQLKSAISEEVGKPLAEADIEVIETSDFLRFFADVAPEVLAPVEPQLDANLWPTKRSLVERVPLGVIGIIKPWNYPLEMIGWTLGPALVAGNTCVIKPSEKSSNTAGFFARMAHDVGLPAGVLNIVYGDSVTGQAVASHKGIDLVSFTGSYRAGKYVAKACAERLARASLELSGNDAAIVLRDADIELAARGLVWGAFCNAGQVCVGIKRAYVADEIYLPLLRKVVEQAKALREGIDYGPIVSKSQLTSLNTFVDDAIKRGAKLECGGRAGTRGYFYEPTVLTNIDPNSRLLGEECFGPVLPIIKVEGADEAVRLANASDYGLGASVWTSDSSEGERIARKLDVGMVWVNDVNVAFPQTPWAGTKASGVGFELSPHALLEYSRFKHISIETSSDQNRAWWYPYG